MYRDKVLTYIVVVSLLSGVFPHVSLGSYDMVFFDDFDDGDYAGWAAQDPLDPAAPVNSPSIIPSPEGFAVQGVGLVSFDPRDPGPAFLMHNIALANVGELRIELQFRLRPMEPFSGMHDSAYLSLVSGTNSYDFRIATPGFGTWDRISYTRDTEGWWSIAYGDSVAWPKAYEDSRLTSFDAVGLRTLRLFNEIEWVRVSANYASTIPAPSGLLLGAIGTGLAGWVRRRRLL